MRPLLEKNKEKEYMGAHLKAYIKLDNLQSRETLVGNPL